MFLLSKCISSMVVNRVVALFPTMPLKAKNISSCKTEANTILFTEYNALKKDLDSETREVVQGKSACFEPQNLSLNL